MNREIKFRQPIRESNGTFIEWFYWGFIDGSFITPANQQNRLKTREESQQYIGLKDKNGKDIYEGDILNTSDLMSVVEWNVDNAQFYVKLSDNIFTIIHNDMEIIGNVYENPELLK